MANVKEVHIQATVPYNWTEKLEPDELRSFVLLLGPVWGLRASFVDLGYVPNNTGGKTSMWKMVIEGHEAVHYELIERMEATLARIGTVEFCECIDIEA